MIFYFILCGLLYLNFLFYKPMLIIGADTWAHLSYINKLKNIFNLFQNPIFGTEIWHYPPLFYLILKFINLIINNILISNVISLFVFSTIYAISFFMFCKKLGFNIKTSVFSTIYTYPFFWETAPKTLFLILFNIFLIYSIDNNKKGMFFVFILIFFTYYLGIPIILLILIFQFFIKFIIKNEIIRKIKLLFLNGNKVIKYNFNYLYFLIISLIYFAIFNYLIELDHPNDWKFFTRFPEIPLNPLYIITFFSILFLPISLKIFFKSSRFNINLKVIMISILFLMFNSLFYYLKIFNFHMRYLSELSITYVVIPIFFYLIFETNLLKRNIINNYKLNLIIILLIFIFTNIYPLYITYTRVLNHAKGSTNYYYIKTKQFMPLIKGIEKSTFLMHPCDYSIRYLIYATNNFVVAANYNPNEYCKANIITTFNLKLDFVKLNFPEERLKTVYSFFNNPCQENFIKLFNKYPFDYILIDKNICKSLEFFINNKLFELINQNENYILFKLNLVNYHENFKYNN